jgi:N-acyl-D-amino-acid deacylase
MAWSLLVRNGTVIDGSAAPGIVADVAIESDRIAAIGPRLDGEAERVVDAAGLAVAPGFIDIHSHSDFFYEQCPSAESKVRQGVTTEVVGMCSFSPAPVIPASKSQVENAAGALGATLEVRWGSFAEYLEVLGKRELSVNVVHFVGHGPLRFAAMGAENREPTAAELDRMKGLLCDALDAGAFGFSSGLVYAPSSFARTEELIELSRSMASRGGQYFTHMRGEAEQLLTSVGEALRIAEEGGVPLQIAHLKSFGRENWPLFDRALETIEVARGRGVPATADVYPYAAGSTFLTALLPGWAHEGGTEKLLERVAHPVHRARLIRDGLQPDGRWATPQGTMGFDEVSVATCPSPSIQGLSLEEVARQRGAPPAEVMLDLLLEHQAQVSVVMFTQAEENVAKALARPYVMVGSDSLGLTCGPGPHAGRPHPRMYGTFPRVLGRYARDKALFSQPEAIAKMTGRPAEKLGLRDRGLLKKGYFADLAIFDPGTVRDVSTFDDPHQYPSGIPYVIVNGRLLVDQGRFTAEPAGRVLRLR